MGCVRLPLVLVYLKETQRRVINVDDVFLIEADGEHTIVHLSRGRRLRDTRRLGELLPLYQQFGFVLIHRNHAVNPMRVYELRRRRHAQDWELRLEPAKNRVLPIARRHLPRLLEVFEVPRSINKE